MKSAIVDEGACWLQRVSSMVVDVLGNRSRVEKWHEGLNRQMACVSRQLSEAEVQVGNHHCGACLATCATSTMTTTIVVTLSRL